MINIEEIAVQRVKREILKYDCLSGYINANDRIPIWDGEIFVYKDKSKYNTDEDFEGRISVQVKGRKVEKLRTGNSKYSIDIKYLKAYQRDKKGVLLFVVEIVDSENTQIYYANLLPVDLKEILEKVKINQKTVSINIRPVKEKSSSSMKMICLNFLKDSNEQMNIEIKRLEEIDTVNEIKLSVVGDKEYLEEYLLNNDVYSYAIEKDTNKKYALSKIKNIQRYKANNVEIKINDKIYYNKILNVKNKEEEYFLCGKATKIDFNKKKITFKLKGNIYDRINDAEFIINFLKYQKITINNEDYLFPINIEKTQIENAIEQLTKNLEYLEKLKNIFSKFNVNFEKDIDTLNKSDIKNLKKFVWLNDGKHIEGMENEGFYFIQIAEYNIAFLVLFDSNRNVKIYNLFEDLSNKIKVFCYDMNKNEVLVSPYISLTSENLVSFSNININIMKNSFEKYEYNDEICLRYNIFVLELIKAYDKSNDKEWLNFAEYLIDKILEFIDLPEYMINKLQIIKRKRKLSQYEKEELYDIREKEKDIMIQCGIAILLENQSDFERFFARLDDKDTFKKFPIYNLIK